MIFRKRKKVNYKITWGIGFFLFVIIAFLAITANGMATKWMIYVTCGFVVLASVIFIFPSFAFTRLEPPDLRHATSKQRSTAFLLFIIQGLFLVTTLLFFYTLEYQTHRCLRIPPLEYGEIITLVQERYWALGFCPWLLYSIMGIGLAFFVNNMHRAPTLYQAILPGPNRHPKLFLYNFFQIIVNIVSQATAFLITAWGIIWLAEALNKSFDSFSWFDFPIRTLVSFGIAILALRKNNLKYLEWMLVKKQGLGAILVGYIALFSILLGLINIAGTYFQLDEAIFNMTKVESSLGLFFNAETKYHRLTLLIMGWWSLFIPWMASLIARLSKGLRVIEILLLTLLFPSIVFLIILPSLKMGFFDQLFHAPSIITHWLIASLIVMVILLVWGRMHNLGDILRGAMPSHPAVRYRPFKKWIRMCIMCCTSYLLGWYTTGWLQTQVVMSLAAFFMFFIVVAFIAVLLLTIIRFLGEEKYKVQATL